MAYIYVIGRRDGPVKIGVTISLESRLATLQTGCPFQIEILHYRLICSRGLALKHEQVIHRVYLEKRLRGEWFDMDSDQGIEAVDTEISIDEFYRNGASK
jgi:predicted GIY-YIG superfamily endonuclease